ncbi:MAG: nucleotidyl transferase AbiEii/AbiGii toxin family protein [Clostridia bacterium]|nr:nucleotidyl transferase AbiEii/AbiGii toxin family protein [Clostridia bacterium]
MELYELIQKYEKIGYKNADATAKVAQDIILLKISKSQFEKNVTIKGGVVMHSISNDMRRATRDLDLDFIKYSLEDKSIKSFINKLNNKDDISIEIVGKITELKHQDYSGKRVIIRLKDKTGYEINTKLDIGVHKDFEIEQDEYCFNLDVFNESVNLFINPIEQIFVEKMKSLLKLGYISARYKDILDFYYLINNCNMNRDRLNSYFKKYIFDDNTMFENNMEDVYQRLSKIFNRGDFKTNFNAISNNWLELPIEEVTQNILIYISEFSIKV